MKSIIFGGSGFIGKHLINKLGSDYLNLDLIKYTKYYKYCDVRNKIDIEANISDDAVIYNLAALCTIPKYEEKEYFETNILGAENVCDFARRKNIKTIVFTSSIAPYGMRENERKENSLPMPTNEYGISKLAAEYIHRIWQAEKPDERKLLILRPGIVFGKGEGGNFSRLYTAMSKGVFFYPGRKNSKKASIYVKDLIQIMIKISKDNESGIFLYNCCYPRPYSIEEICNNIANVTNIKEPKIIIPALLLKILASCILLFGKIFGKKLMDIHPERVEKLMVSTNINGEKLKNNYPLKYNLKEAIQDWYKDCDYGGLY